MIILKMKFDFHKSIDKLFFNEISINDRLSSDRQSVNNDKKISSIVLLRISDILKKLNFLSAYFYQHLP